jgi:chromosome segregation ATPase
MAQGTAQLKEWCNVHDGEEFSDTYEFRSMMDRRRRHVEAHLEGYEKQARELDTKILRIQDPQKAIRAEHERDAHARKIYALTLGCDEAEVPVAVAAMPLASEAFQADPERAIACIMEAREELSHEEQVEEAECSIERHSALIEQYQEWCEVLQIKIRRLESRCEAAGDDTAVVEDEISDLHTLNGEYESVREKLETTRNNLQFSQDTLAGLGATAA